MVNDNTSPAWEMVLSVEGTIVCTAAAFRDGKDRFIILVGVQEERHVLAYADLVREAAFRVAVADNFRTVDEIAAASRSGNETSAPF